MKDRPNAFTPGPWVAFDRDTVSNIYTTGNAGSMLAQVHSYEVATSDKRPDRLARVANARLIAAAPTMHEALTVAAIAFRQYEASHLAKGTQEAAEKAHRNHELAALCEAALAKALPADPAGDRDAAQIAREAGQ